MSFLKAVMYAVRIFLSSIFLLSSVMKITPALHQDTHYMLAEKFRSYLIIWKANAFDHIGLDIDDTTYRLSVGFTELFCLFLLWTSLRKISAFILMSIMAGAVLTHFWLKEDVVFPSILCGLCFMMTLFGDGTPKTIKSE